jgi:hypothetical protein
VNKTLSAIEGTIKYSRSNNNSKCVCCHDGVHVYSKRIELDDFESAYPKNFGKGLFEFIGTAVLQDNTNENKRIRITVEIL